MKNVISGLGDLKYFGMHTKTLLALCLVRLARHIGLHCFLGVEAGVECAFHATIDVEKNFELAPVGGAREI